jgi:ethanolamine permease
MVLFVSASLPPGVAQVASIEVLYDMFQIPHHYAALLSLPAAFATSFGFMWAYGKLIAALSTSRLLFPFCAKTTKEGNTPYNALLIGSAFSYGLCLVVFFVPEVGESFTGVCMLSASMSYAGQCVGYIALKKNYRNIKSSAFKSPFGIAGAFVSLLIWLLMAASLLTVHDDGGVDAIGFALIVILFTVFYFGYARKRQTFSPQENKIMLVAHVTKFNIKKVAANRQQRHHKVSGSSGDSSLSEMARKVKKSVSPFSFATKSSNSTRVVSVNPLSTGSGPKPTKSGSK